MRRDNEDDLTHEITLDTFCAHMVRSLVRIAARSLHSVPGGLLRMASLENAKKIAAYKAVNEYVQVS